jgi:DNA-binding HxlR family transcriptional regulator
MTYEPKRPPLDPCPVEEVIAIVGGKWKARILYLLALQPHTFAGLRRGLPGIKQQVFADQLKALCSDGIVERNRTLLEKTSFSTYKLTAEGETLIPVLCTLSEWGAERLRARGINCNLLLPTRRIAS